MHTVLVLGGYGFFGSRICASLAQSPSVRLLIGGRDPARGSQTAQKLNLDPEQVVRLLLTVDEYLAPLKGLEVWEVAP